MKTLTDRLSLERLEALVAERAAAELWRDDARVLTWRDFGRRLDEAHRACTDAGVEPGEVVLTPGETGIAALAWLLAVAQCGGVAAPLRAVRQPELARWAAAVRVDWQVRGSRLVADGTGESSPAAAALLAQLRARAHPGLILATGGTTGVPKLVLHDLAVLLGAVSCRTGRPWRVLPLMYFDHIGGLDMAWRALAAGQVLVAPPAEPVPEAVAATIARHRVEVLPATPSFLNLLLLSGAAQAHDLSSLRVVPYGAEPMPGGLLPRLQVALPGVDFVQRFGTSETGTLPARGAGTGLVLGDGAEGFAWKVVDGELWVRSPTRALGYLAGDPGGFAADGWFRTGDLAEQRPDGSVQVIGRQAELINVGGEKVLPGVVEAVLLEHPDVADCRVHGAHNLVLGQVVAAEIVWRGAEDDALEIKRLLRSFAAPRLARHQLPAVVTLVERIGTTRNFKKSRTQP